MPKQTTGEFMATLRKANGYTQQEVSEKLNISNRTLSSWETDRTLPDVLMLPAIADLYGVTVDELLRGERNNGNDNKHNDISENSMKNVYKNKFGSFAAKYALILGIALICAAVFVLACALSLWTYTPAWLDWLLLVLGIVGLCTCIAVIAYQYNNVKLSIGVVLDEDLTDEKKAFVTALRHKLENFMLFCALPLALFALITLMIFIVVNPQYEKVLGFTFYVRNGYILMICLSFGLALILFVAYLILKAVTVKKYYSETQKSTAKHNRRLAGKLAVFGSIPVALVIVFNVVLALAVYPERKSTTLYQCDNWEALKTHLQTLVIEKDDSDIPAGEYYLAFPDHPEYGETYDLGNGFFGEIYSVSYSDDYSNYVAVKPYLWQVCYKQTTEPWDDWMGVRVVGKFYVHGYGTTEIVNARYYTYDNTLRYDGLDNVFRKNSFIAKTSDGQYCFVNRENLDEVSATTTDLMIYTSMLIPITTIVVCGIVYAEKRKKQKYNF